MLLAYKLEQRGNKVDVYHKLSSHIITATMLVSAWLRMKRYLDENVNIHYVGMNQGNKIC